MELENFDGCYILDGVDYYNPDNPDDREESYGQCIRFRLDGITYLALEDPDDGYRSAMAFCDECDGDDLDKFTPCLVVANVSADGNLVEFTDFLTHKTVLEIGTDYSDSYYPVFVSYFQAENMSSNHTDCELQKLRPTKEITPMELTQEQIDCFDAEGFFRLKKVENQRKLFDKIWPEFSQYYTKGNTSSDEFFESLLQHHEKIKNEKKLKKSKKLAEKNNRPICTGAKSADEHITVLPEGRYVITSAQNNTHVNKDFLGALLKYCWYNNAQLIIAKITYNKTAFLQQDDDSIWYDPDIVPYLMDGHISLGGYAHVLLDSNVIPTAKNPLTGFAAATGVGIHVVVPHAKIALRISAAMKNAATKMLVSTGSVTLPNYIMKRTGVTSALEHCHGAVLVDCTDKKIRHLQQMAGEEGFYDIDRKYYTDIQVTEVLEDCVESIQLGDIHAEKMESQNLRKCIDLIQKLEPKNLLLEDVSDFSSRNHHNIKCPIFLHEQHLAGNTVQSDLKIVARTIDKLGKSFDGVVHIIESNHDTAINTWLSRENVIKDDPANAITYLQCMLALYKHQAKSPGVNFNMLKYAYKAIGRGKLKDDKLVFHETDESFILAGIEHCHGNHGIGGSRGSVAQFRTLGIPLNTGHTHTPSICGFVFTAGVAAGKDLGYNRGASNWELAHIVTFVNGQRQIIFN